MSPEEFRETRLAVIELAKRWQDAVIFYLEDNARRPISGAEFLRKGISFAFPDDLILEAPDRDTVVAGDEHRSPFSSEDVQRKPYDILVSLEDLPINRIDPFRITGDVPGDAFVGERDGLDRIGMPISELGSYARRVDYGIPTIYLGRFGAALEKTWAEYRKSPLWQHVVVHEFGHALGLPHEHQNPHYPETFYKDVPAIRSEVADVFEVKEGEITDRDIVEHIIGRWPGSPDFSDWAGPGYLRPFHDIDSIMAYPFHHRLLKQRPNDPTADLYSVADLREYMHRLGQPADAPPGGPASTPPPSMPPFITHPTPTDVQTLLRMYCPYELKEVAPSTSGASSAEATRLS